MAKGKAKGITKNKSKSERSGLNFPVGRIRRFLKQGRYAKRVGQGAAIYLTAVLEYLTAEVVELAGNNAKLMKKKRIIPRMIFLALKEDAELDQLAGDLAIREGGARQQLHPFLLPKRFKK